MRRALVKMATPGAVEAKGTGGGTDKMAALKEIYKQLKAEVLEDHAAEIADHESAIQWIDRVMLSQFLPPSSYNLTTWVLA